jgi:hypothetical protein
MKKLNPNMKPNLNIDNPISSRNYGLALYNYEEKNKSENIEEKQQTNDLKALDIASATTQGFFQHPILVQNNFTIKNEKISKKEKNDTKDKEQEKEFYINSNNTSRNFHKRQTSELMDKKSIQIKIESPITIHSHRYTPSVNSFESNRILLNRRNDNSPDKDTSENRRASTSSGNSNNNRPRSDSLVDSILEVPHVTITKQELKSFLFMPIPPGKTLTCNVTRKRLSDDKNKEFFNYYVFLSDNDRFVMASFYCKKKSCYYMTMGNDFSEEKNHDSLGSIRSNYFGTEFNIFDPGSRPRKGVSIEETRVNLGTVRFEVSFFGLKNPRKVSLYLPKVDLSSYKAKAKDFFVKNKNI